MNEREVRRKLCDRFEVYELLDYLDLTVEEFVEAYFDDLISNEDLMEEIGEKAIIVDDEY